MASRMKCRRDIDAAICKLKSQRKAIDRAEARHYAVRQFGTPQDRATIEKYDCACIRAEGRQGGYDSAICHRGRYRTFLKEAARIYADGNHVQSVHFTDDLANTSCGYWARRDRARR